MGVEIEVYRNRSGMSTPKRKVSLLYTSHMHPILSRIVAFAKAHPIVLYAAIGLVAGLVFVVFVVLDRRDEAAILGAGGAVAATKLLTDQRKRRPPPIRDSSDEERQRLADHLDALADEARKRGDDAAKEKDDRKRLRKIRRPPMTILLFLLSPLSFFGGETYAAPSLFADGLRPAVVPAITRMDPKPIDCTDTTVLLKGDIAACAGLLVGPVEYDYVYQMAEQRTPILDLLRATEDGRVRDRVEAEARWKLLSESADSTAKMLADQLAENQRLRAAAARRPSGIGIFFVGTGVGAGIVAAVLVGVVTAAN